MLVLISLSIIEAMCLVLGIFSPFAKIQEFWFFGEEFSVYRLIITLFDQRNFLLSGTILLFGILIPLARLFGNCFPDSHIGRLNLHKLAMLDIFLISFLLFSSQLSYFFEVSLLEGFYFLFLAMIISNINRWFLRRNRRL